MSRMGNTERQVPKIREAVENYRATGAAIYTSFYLAHLAEACQAEDDLDGMEAALKEAFSFMNSSDERQWEAEIYRLRGELHRLRGEVSNAEAAFKQALQIADRCKGKIFASRAGEALAQLLSTSGEDRS